MLRRSRTCRLVFGLLVTALYSCSTLMLTPAEAQEFQIVVGGTEDPFRWPEAEGPENVINWEGQKYLNFNRENTGFYVRPEAANAGDIATSITFWTANDAVERDPASYRLFGSNSGDLQPPLDYFPQDTIPFDLFTEISAGDLALPESRNEGGTAMLDDFNSQTIQFENSMPFESYMVIFPTVKDPTAANSMQIAEVQLNYDGFIEDGIFDFQDEIVGVGLVEPPQALQPLVIENFQMIVGGTEDPVRWPEAEGPSQAIDWQGQKYLNFQRENTGILVQPQGPNAGDAPNSITFWAANDAVERDPSSFRLLGSNNSDLLSPADYQHTDEISLASFTEIAFGNLELPATRNDGGEAALDDFNSQTISFQNSEAFENYVVVFSTVKDGATANSMQIAEVQLNYDGFIEDGVFDFEDAVTGIALADINSPIEPVDPIDPVQPTDPLTPIITKAFDIVVGSTEAPIQWPGAEGPENAINWQGQKYLNFERENTGVLIRPGGPNADDVATSITFWTANDSVERDPANFRLFGSNSDDLISPDEYEHLDEIPLELFTEVAFGELELPESRNDGGEAELDDANSWTVEFENGDSFDTYLVVFPNVKDGATANSMQIAEIQLNYGDFIEDGIFDFEDSITGVALRAIEAICDPNSQGDTDGDGSVTFADFLVLSNNFSQEVGSHEQGDFDCNGIVEFADFLILSNSFGTTVGEAGATSSVPEPSGLSLLAFTGLLLGTLRRRNTARIR